MWRIFTKKEYIIENEKTLSIFFNLQRTALLHWRYVSEFKPPRVRSNNAAGELSVRYLRDANTWYGIRVLNSQ